MDQRGGGAEGLFIYINPYQILQKEELIALIDRYLEGTATEPEQEMIANYYHSFQQENGWDEVRFGAKSDAVAEVIARVKQQVQENKQEIPSIHRIHFIRRTWVRYAAAIIFLIAGFGTWYILQQPAVTIIMSLITIARILRWMFSMLPVAG